MEERCYVRPSAGRNDGRELNLERRRLCENLVDAGYLSDDVEDIASAWGRPTSAGGVESGVPKRSIDESSKDLWRGHQRRVL